MRAMRWLMVPILVSAMGGVAAAEWKNVQVLPKTMSKDELKALMKAQSKALGVECDYCHDVPDMASDKNEKKLIARKMMQMQNEINEKWIKGWKGADKAKVSCGTCHQGHEEPPKFTVQTGSDKPQTTTPEKK
ncbi:MAG: c-type cytochrome [Myxococcales bacterium]|nr:c-type cytochrome [Myxococcales bacterium]